MTDSASTLFLQDMVYACQGSSLPECLELLFQKLHTRDPARRFALHSRDPDVDIPRFWETRDGHLAPPIEPPPWAKSLGDHSRQAYPDTHIPIRYRNEPIGFIQELEPGATDPSLDSIALGIEILYAHIRGRVETAHRDPLTGLWNRAHLQPALTKAWTEAAEKGAPLSFCLMDMDGFKTVNDTHGHLTGDHVLQTCAEKLSALMAEPDVAGRWGGDEFWLILPDTDEHAARATAERCCKELIPLLAGVTLSIGVATVHPDPRMPVDVRPLIETADEDLRRKKKQNR